MFRKIIFSITPESSATRDYIIEAGHLAFAEHEINNFVNSIENLLQNRNHYYGTFNKDYYSNFLPSTIAKLFVEIINESKLLA